MSAIITRERPDTPDAISLITELETHLAPTIPSVCAMRSGSREGHYEERMRIVNRFYAFIGWAIVGLGVLHMLATLRLSSSTPSFRLWFFGSGMAIALVGALNLLHRAYGRSATGLRIVCWAANALLTLFALAAGALSHVGVLEYVFIVGLVGGALILSFVRTPQEQER